MPWSFISDVHIQDPSDSRNKIIQIFLKKSNDLKVDKIFFLGDIFDLMVGEKKEYLNYYDSFFNALASSKVKEIHFFEGNHDFHLKSLWKSFKKKYPQAPRVFYHQKGLILEKSSLKIWMSHGDDIEIGNYSYKIYRFIIRSQLVRFLARWFLPISLIKKIGKKIPTRRAEYDAEDQRNKFRFSAVKWASKMKVQVIISGHSHIKDMIHLENCIYINNGYPSLSRCFGFISDEGNLDLLDLYK